MHKREGKWLANGEMIEVTQEVIEAAIAVRAGDTPAIRKIHILAGGIRWLMGARLEDEGMGLVMGKET